MEERWHHISRRGMLYYVLTRGSLALLLSACLFAIPQLFNPGSYRTIHRLHLEWIAPIVLISISYGLAAARYIGWKIMFAGRTIETYRVTP
jgi:hypothetical protein